jgi:hypothetical protein
MKLNFPVTELKSDTFFIQPDSSVIDLSTDEIAEESGYERGNAPDYFRDIIAESITKCKSISRPACGYRILSINKEDTSPESIAIGDIRFNCQKIVTTRLKDTDKIALFSCTIGSEMETYASRCFAEGDAVKGHFADVVASAAVELITDLLHNHIAEIMCQLRLGVTNRFSPGYCGWPVSEQNTLFSFFPDGFCGIKVTDSSLMLPKKSTSGIIGIGPAAKREPYTCNRCSQKECTYRMYRANRMKNDE